MWMVSGSVYRQAVEDLAALRELLIEERSRHEILAVDGRAELTTVRAQLGVEQGKREILAQTTAVLTAQLEFLCSRVNQLETERVILLRTLTNLELPAPTMRTRPVPVPADDATDLGIFEDDPRHAPAGWHEDGSVNYGQGTNTP